MFSIASFIFRWNWSKEQVLEKFVTNLVFCAFSFIFFFTSTFQNVKKFSLLVAAEPIIIILGLWKAEHLPIQSSRKETSIKFFIHITPLVSQGEGWPRVTKYDVGMILVGGWKSFCVTRHNMNHRGHLAAIIMHPFPPWTHGVCMTPTLFWQEGKPARALEALPA